MKLTSERIATMRANLESWEVSDCVAIHKAEYFELLDAAEKLNRVVVVAEENDRVMFAIEAIIR